ncbi:ATP-binding cassette domain-containing protein [Candidatus Bathyarchaeota archaeon]|nr:ATP-binding cassette domain-containing protein [Candidatus Bathyarchaeota archaeon]
MIEVKDVYYTYPNGFTALRGVNLTIHKGECVAIMGENGAGKTTLVKHFNGLLKPTRGTVVVDGVKTKDASVAQLSRKVGLVFQNPDHQFFSETVEEEVAFALKNFGFPEDEVERRVEEVLKRMGLLGYRKSSPFSLSGGEKKRLAIASIVVFEPEYLVLDEPTIGQDYIQKVEIKKVIDSYLETGRTVVIVTHDLEFVVDLRPRVVLMSRGRIIADGKAEEILSDSKLMDDASLLLPQMTELAYKLGNPKIPRTILDENDMLEVVKPLLKHRGGWRS